MIKIGVLTLSARDSFSIGEDTPFASIAKELQSAFDVAERPESDFVSWRVRGLGE